MADVLDPEVRHLLKAQSSALRGVEELVDVTDAFRDTVRLIAHRMVGNAVTELFLFQVVQLSELGTGWSSSFENGNAQSDRRDDVMFELITEMCGIPCTLRLRGDRLTIKGNNGFERSAAFPNLDRSNRGELARTLDELLLKWWNGG